MLKVVGANPSRVYCMDIFSNIFFVKIAMLVCIRPKINEKEAGDCPFLKIKRGDCSND